MTRYETPIGNIELLEALLVQSEVEETGEHPHQQKVEELVDRLFTEQEKEIYYLKYGEQLSFRQIAERLGYRSHSVAQKRVASIKKKIGEALAGEYVAGDS